MARRKRTVRRRSSTRSRKVQFDQKLVIDGIGAGVATRLLPLLVNKFFPLSPTLYSVVGAGGGYLLGVMLKRSALANISISNGIVEIAAPMLEDLVGGITGTAPQLPTGAPTVKNLPTGMVQQTKKAVDIADFMRLNEYTNDPSLMPASIYRDSY